MVNLRLEDEKGKPILEVIGDLKGEPVIVPMEESYFIFLAKRANDEKMVFSDFICKIMMEAAEDKEFLKRIKNV